MGEVSSQSRWTESGCRGLQGRRPEYGFLTEGNEQRGPRQRNGGRKISTQRAQRMRPPLRQKNLRQNNGEETKRNRKEASAKKSKTRKLTENEPLIFAYVLALMNAKPPFQCFHFSVFN